VTNPEPAASWSMRIAALPPRSAARLQAAIWIAVTAVVCIVNSVTVGADLRRQGVQFDAIEPWIWECTSGISLLIWLLPLLRGDAALRRRVASPWGRLAAWAAGSVVFSLAHVLTMVGLRHLAYRVLGGHYDFGPWADALLYEYRKDALTYALLLAIAAGWRALRTRREDVEPVVSAVSAVAGTPGTPVGRAVDAEVAADAEAAQSPAGAPTFLARTAQGDLLVRADEVDWIEAQGNYVALHVQGKVRLIRHTLAEMEARLKEHGFIRTHRRALVNRERMRAILPPERGELGVRLSSGQVAPLSESRRAEVVRLVLGTPA